MVNFEEMKMALIEADENTMQLANQALAEGISARKIVSDVVMPATKLIGDKYENGEYFLSDLVLAGEALEAMMKPVSAKLQEEIAKGGEPTAGKVVLATVEGDIHDIGKNLVKIFLEGFGFDVVDMGVDIPPNAVIDKAIKEKADIIALSCLMSVTRDNVENVIKELEKRGIRQNYAVLVGGRSTTEKWAKEVGCDGWSPDAPASVDTAKSLIMKK
ncbi:MAG: B12-binding domain-containing protein [Promethearchaeota archaeon]